MIKNKVYIQNFWYNNINYGAILTAMALYEVLEQLNYDVTLIDFANVAPLSKNIFRKFIKNNFKITKPIEKYSDFSEIDQENATNILGSDQVLRPYIAKYRLPYFLFNYLSHNVRKIAFSASFGTDKETLLKEISDSDIEILKRSLKNFDFVSIREFSGVEICKNLFDIDAKWVIDPVFLVDKSYYAKLANNSKKNFNGKIVTYFLTNNSDMIYINLKQKYNKDFVELYDSDLSIEDWLNAIKTSDLFVTDSFHGTCFAIIFNKPFICVNKNIKVATRFDSLFKMLEIENRTITRTEEVFNKDCIYDLDYEKINKNIEKEAKKGLALLEQALNIPIKQNNILQNDFKEELFSKGVMIKEGGIRPKTTLVLFFKELCLAIFSYFPFQIRRFVRRGIVLLSGGKKCK